MSQALQEYKPEASILVHKDVRFHPTLTFGEKIFFAEIQAMTKKADYPFSSRSFSKIFGVSHQTILNWIRRLTDLDLVEIWVDYNNQECRQFIRTKKK